jgi:hypothetical protein
MITGFTVTVPGSEMKDLFKKRAKSHRDSAEKAVRDRQELNERIVDPAYSKFQSSISSWITSSLKAKDEAEFQTKSAEEMEFLSAHVDESESYELSEKELRRLGIVQ